MIANMQSKFLFSIILFLFQMSLVLIFIVAVIMYRILVSIPLFQNQTLRGQANLIASTSSAVVNLILIMALGKVYEKLALKLTQWGMNKKYYIPCLHLVLSHFILASEFY